MHIWIHIQIISLTGKSPLIFYDFGCPLEAPRNHKHSEEWIICIKMSKILVEAIASLRGRLEWEDLWADRIVSNDIISSVILGEKFLDPKPSRTTLLG